MSSFKYQGKWWLPGREDKSVEGRLEVGEQEPIRLYLDGTFQNASCKIILGEAYRKQIKDKITLYKCKDAQPNIWTAGSRSTFTSEYAFLGCHFGEEQEIKYDHLAYQIPYLGNWYNPNGFTSYTERGHGYVYETKSNEYSIDSKYSPKIILNCSVNPSRRGDEGKVKQITSLQIKYDEPTDFTHHLKLWSKLRDFFTLAVGENVDYKKMYSKSELFSDDTSANPRKILIYRNRSPSINEVPLPSGGKTVYLLPFDKITEGLESTLRNWITSYENLGPVYDLYFGTRYNRNMSLENQFLNILQALESYHRRKTPYINQHYLEEEVYESKVRQKLIESLPNDIPDSLTQRLEHRFKFGNEYPLRKRMEGIIQCFEGFIPEGLSSDAFINKVVQNRHYLTHWTEDLESQTNGGQEIPNLLPKVKLILEGALLNEMGLEERKIKVLLSNFGDYKKYYT